MKNFVSIGSTLTLIAPAGGVISGKPTLIESLLVIPKSTVVTGTPFVALKDGVFRLSKKASDTPSQLQKAYWDESENELTTTDTDNKLVGVFTQSGAADQTEIEVLLTGEV